MRQVVFALLKKINYAYDHSGERTLKMTGDAYDVDQNAREQYLFASLNNITIFLSPYTVVSNQGYTKHYYAGAERVAARLGGGGLGYDTACISQNPEVSRCADSLFQHVLKSVNSYEYQKQDCLDVVRIDGSVLGESSGFNGDNFPIRLNADVRAEPLRLNRIIEGSINPIVIDSSYEPDVYFYHSDHLGSASWITDAEGIPVQHLQYLPFGEPFVNQRISGYQERFTFTGKERDTETGFSYFGARYYDSDLSGLFLSVDPMADNYPSLSPYAYCAWNPVKLVDPDGREVGDYYTKNGRWLGSDGYKDDLAYTAKSVQKNSRGFVISAENKELLPIRNSELLDRATWVCGESGGSGEYISDRTQNAGDASAVSDARVVDYYAYAINNASITDGGFYNAAKNRMGRMKNNVYTKTYEGYFEGRGLGGNDNSKAFANARFSDMGKINQDDRFTNSISAVIKSVTNPNDPTGGCRAWLGSSDANKYVKNCLLSIRQKGRITASQFSFNSNNGRSHHSFYYYTVK